MALLPSVFRLSSRSIPFGFALLGLVGCNIAPTSDALRLATGSPTGYYYQLGQALESSVEESVQLDVDVIESKGSTENLERLLAHDIDFALVQLDVAEEAMKSGEVKAIAVLAQEHVHLISRQFDEPRATAKRSDLSQADLSQADLSQADLSQPGNSEPELSISGTDLSTEKVSGSMSLMDLGGTSIAIGSPGSGIRFTADQILVAAQLNAADGQIAVNESGFSESLELLSKGEVDAAFYVGRLGASQTVRDAFEKDPTLTLLPLSPSLVNFLATQNPGVYRAAAIPRGIYGVQPSIPDRKITTLTTPTVLITRPDTNEKAVQLMTWSIVATARRYATFYPELQAGDPNLLLRQGLFHVHPSATEVYEEGDPRRAWIRYWENNSDLQAGLFLLVATSGVGMLLRRWRKQRSQHLINQTNARISEISKLLKDKPQEAQRSIKELDQDNRLQFIAGKVSDEVYSQVQQRTQSFSDQCNSIIETQRSEQILETLLLLDEWQETLQTDPDLALKKLSQIRQQYREMLLSNQVDIQAYMELVELTLISLMTLAPQQREQVDMAAVLTSADSH
ncbi:MAG: TAXI family TRAP transporter solute-binding subunit [Cyanobacteria bacterium P01_F01_bin.53]